MTSVKVHSPRIMAKVIVFHDFDFRRGLIIDLFRLSERDAIEARYIAQQMCDGLLRDIAELRLELDDIDQFARQQLKRPIPTD